MAKYVVKRFLLLIPTLLLVCLIIFTLMRMIPGSAVDVIIEKIRGGSGVAPDRAVIEAKLGLDKPFFVQFFTWLGSVLKGDLGTPIFQTDPVGSIIMHKLPITLELVFLTLLISVVVSIPLGLLAAAYQDAIADNVIRVVSVVIMSLPIFWVATLVLVYPAAWWGYVPPAKYVPFFSDPVQNLRMFLPPALIGGLANAGGNLRSVRTLTLEVLRQDYIRTAWSKGLKERTILFAHAFRNTLIPTITMIGGSITGLMGGSVILENLFNIPGIGTQLTSSLNVYDYPVVQGCVLIMAIIGMLITLIVDLSYSTADPRVKLD